MTRQYLTAAAGCIMIALAGCEAVDGGSAFSEDTGGVTASLSRCAGGTNGQSDFCSVSCTCAIGQGDCDSSAECDPGLVCRPNAGASYGLAPGVDVCVAATCSNAVWDIDECGLNCGGTSACPACTVTRLSANCGGVVGGGDYCINPNFPCGAGEGDCDSDAQCLPGLICRVNAGVRFGLPAGTDACVSPTCGNGVWDANECGVDCGGSSGCGTCAAPLATKSCGAVPGDPHYCRNPNFPCTSGEADCDSDSECASGLVCLVSAGARFGYSTAVDVCAPAHCRDTVLSGDETGTDCGGSCGTCLSGGTGGTANWSHSAGGAGEDRARAVAVDSVGNTYVTGYFSGTINFGGSDLVSAGGRDIFIASYDPTGAHRWSMRAGDARDFQFGLGITVDSADDVVVTGYFTGTINLGGADLVTMTQQNVFVAKFDMDGNHVWSVSLGDDAFHEQGWSVTTDPSDDVIITGYYLGGPDFGGGVLPTSTGGYGVFVAKLSGGSGTHVWSRGFGGSGNSYARSVATDSSGNVYISGQFDTSVNFGGATLSSAGSLDGFVASFSSAGTHRWSTRYGSGGEQHVRHIAVDSSDNVVIAGWFEGTVNVGCGSLSASGTRDMLVAKLSSSNGSCVWSRRLGGTSPTYADALTTGANNRIYVGGFFEGTTNFGTGNLTSAGGRDAVVLGLLSTGSTSWARRYGSAGDQYTTGLADVPGGTTISAVGYFPNTISFTAPLSSVGGDDTWVASIRQ